MSGPAAHGLCTAYAHLKGRGNGKQKAVAFRALVTAAGGAAHVTAYCAAVAHLTAPPGQEAGKAVTHPGPGKSHKKPPGQPSTQVPAPHHPGKPRTS